MAYEVIILGHLHMPLYFLGTFTEYPFLDFHLLQMISHSHPHHSYLLRTTHPKLHLIIH